MSNEPVRVFIGSGEASAVERRVLIHSLKKHSSRPLDLYVFNGTHNAVEHNDEPPFAAPMPLEIKYRNITEFSLYRFLIPEVCGFEGKAIFLDSDIVALDDIAKLWDMDMGDAAILAVPEYAENNWATSVMLLDCARARFNLPEYFRNIDNGVYNYAEMSRFDPAFREFHDIKLSPIDRSWNSFDYHDKETHCIHYTNLSMQPWKFPNHPYGELWFEYLHEALEAGALTQELINLTITRGYIRPDIMAGNWREAAAGSGPRKKKLSPAKKVVREIKRFFRGKKAA